MNVKEQFNFLATKYPAIKKKNFYYYENLINEIGSHITLPDDPILEIGCGTGGILNNVSKVPGTGIDISDKMIEEARKLYPKHTFLCGKVEDLTIEESFNTVIMADVAEYIKDLNTTFNNIYKMLRKNGLLIITSPNPSWRRILSLASILNLKMNDEHSNPPHPKKIISAATQNNMKLISFSTHLHIPKYTKISTWLNSYIKKKSLLADFGLIMSFTFKRIY